MTTTDHTTEGETPAEAPDQPFPATAGKEPDTSVEQPEDDETGTGTGEAAKYRRRLREAEAQLKTVTEHLHAVQRQQVEAQLATVGVKPDAVFAVTGLADLLAEDGSLDADKITAAVETARETFGIPKKPAGSAIPGIGNQPRHTPQTDKWSEAFSPPSRR